MTMPVSPKRSKRSSRVALTTMAVLGTGAMLSACGENSAPAANAAVKVPKTEVQVFENSFVCAKVTGKSREECDTMRTEALALSKREAPRFEAIQDCEARFGEGQCVEDGVGEPEGDQYARHGRSHFSPFVIAWFSRSNSNAPLFSDKRGGYQTANGTRLSYAGSPGKYVATNRAFERAKSVPSIKPASKLAKKGGFGERTRSWNLADRNGKAIAGTGGPDGKAGSSAGSKGG